MFESKAVVSKKKDASGNLIKDDTGAQVYTALASTPDLDRDREVLLPQGCHTEFFEKNPTILGFHERREWPIGKGVDIRIDEKGVEVDFVFADTDEGKKAQYLYDNGFMKAFSVGLGIMEYDAGPFESGKDEDTRTYVTPMGEVTLDVGQFKGGLQGVIPNWELRELSAVTVPANPHALLKGVLESEMATKSASDFATSKVKSILEEIERLDEVSPVIPYMESELGEHDDFDPMKARAQFAMFSSEDGSGISEQINWEMYSRCFAIMNPDHPEKFSSYELAHHTIEDGEIKLNWKGLHQSMARVLGYDDEGLFADDEIRREAYEHLSAHYHHIGKEVPEAKKYEVDELERYFELGAFKDKGDEGENTPEPTGSAGAMKELTEAIKSLRMTMKEEFVGMRIALEVSRDSGSSSGDIDPSDIDDDDQEMETENVISELKSILSPTAEETEK